MLFVPLFPFYLVGEFVDLGGQVGEVAVGAAFAAADGFQQPLRRGEQLREGAALRALLRRRNALGADYRGGVPQVEDRAAERRFRLVAERFQRFDEARAGYIVAVVDEDMPRAPSEALYPRDKPVFVRVAAYPLQQGNAAINGDFLAEKLDLFHAVVDYSAERAFRLIADEEHHAFLAPEVVFEVVADAPRLAHAAGGDYHLRRRVEVDRLRFLRADRDMQVVEPEGVDAVLYQRERFFVEACVVALHEDARRFQRERAVDVNGEARVAGDHILLFYPADKIEYLLRSADGEGGDEHVSARVERGLDAVAQDRDVVRALVFVQAVAVGGFHDEPVAFKHRARILDYRLVGVADVAAENDFAVFAAFGKPYLDRRGAEQVADVGEADIHSLEHADALIVIAGAELRDKPLHVVDCVYRLAGLLALALRAAVAPFGLGFLDVRGVHQHYLHQIAGRGGRVDLPAETVFIKQRQLAGVVDVRVSQQHAFDLRGTDGQLRVDEGVRALLHSAVDKDVSAVYFEQRAAAGNFVISAEKGDFHMLPPVRVFIM